jgi:hypothetical protein
MGDPVKRMHQFVADQKQQACYEDARAVWSRKVAELLPAIEAVADIMRDGLLPDQFQGTPIAVLSDTTRMQYPLVIAFSSRDRTPPEIGASAVFRCEPDGQVHGYRYPFHSTARTVDPEEFVNLGNPNHITPDALGNAIADFLEWAASSADLHFWSPATLPFPQPTFTPGKRAA